MDRGGGGGEGQGNRNGPGERNSYMQQLDKKFLQVMDSSIALNVIGIW